MSTRYRRRSVVSQAAKRSPRAHACCEILRGTTRRVYTTISLMLLPVHWDVLGCRLLTRTIDLRSVSVEGATAAVDGRNRDVTSHGIWLPTAPSGRREKLSG
ncbi:hypothetical protein AVEN_155874-1 [Araneus ventricosus]|uniref:Uncharacterized protein n=1 Tax=Araneus ventricosus TaxID=182803 RepID=A0A4Y2UUD9_ARAVE|nr:hypothetical protein AVEN_236963-1 [Araneus ventricosus]GBO16485.1 hypothetical protein AVEN_138899-1 [Araneus ventricosus]GBO16488.1 hypothetical protein AVEN_78290-1 [Araneus ventricosus]GBO16489.1 hypothetical protein AVEN_155874-1 [Araneus ventricosus]